MNPADRRDGGNMHAAWREGRVLITGATGLLGSWLVEAVLARGGEPVALVRDGVPDARFHAAGLDRRTVVVRGALEDFALVERVVNEYDVATVFHLGAQTLVATANRSPLSTFEANIRGTWHVLEAVRTSPWVKRVVVASSDKAYGRQSDLPYREETPLLGRHPYDVSKACADLLAQAYAHTYGLAAVVARCGNLFGGGDLNFNRLVPGVIRDLLAGRRPLIRSDGTPKRDYLYVKDAADGYCRLAERADEEGVRGRAFNFGTHTPRTPLEVTARIARLAGREELAPDVRATWKGEIQDQVLDAGLAREVLGWTPAYDFDAALAETLDWYRAYLADPR